MSKVNEGYIEGIIKYIQEHHPGLDGEINKADDRILEVWKACNQGEAVIEDFKGALASYANLHLKAIDKFKSKSVVYHEKISI